jgi:hypothetical protein
MGQVCVVQDRQLTGNVVQYSHAQRIRGEWSKEYQRAEVLFRGTVLRPA